MVETVFSSFTSFVEGETNFKNTINKMENTLLNASILRRRITEMYKEDLSKTIKTSTELKNYNEIMLDINSQCDLLFVDMQENYDIDIQDTVRLIKEYAEDISKSYNDSTITLKADKNEVMTKLELNEYLENLNVLNDRIVRFNLNNIESSKNKRSVEVEAKFSRLSEDILLFTKMVKAQTSLRDGDKTLNKQTDDHTYNFEVIDQLLSKTNEVTFTLSNKHNK